MPDRWVPDTAGEQALLEGLAAGFDAFAELVVERVKTIERGHERYHFRPGHNPFARKPPRGGNVPYLSTIGHATYLNGVLVGGTNVRGGARPKGDSIHARVYSTSFLGHMLELTGAKAHEIPIPISDTAEIIVHHPGFHARPHFVPGLLSAVGQVGATMAAKVNRRQSAPGTPGREGHTFVGNE